MIENAFIRRLNEVADHRVRKSLCEVHAIVSEHAIAELVEHQLERWADELIEQLVGDIDDHPEKKEK